MSLVLTAGLVVLFAAGEACGESCAQTSPEKENVLLQSRVTRSCKKCADSFFLEGGCQAAGGFSNYMPSGCDGCLGDAFDRCSQPDNMDKEEEEVRETMSMKIPEDDVDPFTTQIATTAKPEGNSGKGSIPNESTEAVAEDALKPSTTEIPAVAEDDDDVELSTTKLPAEGESRQGGKGGREMKVEEPNDGKEIAEVDPFATEIPATVQPDSTTVFSGPSVTNIPARLDSALDKDHVTEPSTTEMTVTSGLGSTDEDVTEASTTKVAATAKPDSMDEILTAAPPSTTRVSNAPKQAFNCDRCINELSGNLCSAYKVFDVISGMRACEGMDEACSRTISEQCSDVQDFVQDCHTAIEGDDCFSRVMWVFKTGIHTHPEWYPSLDKTSTFEDIQQHVHDESDNADSDCPRPCPAEPVVCHTAVQGEECHKHVKWAMEVGIVQMPEVYTGLTAESPFKKFQDFMYRSHHGSCPTPCP